ncbi:hypothetical protein ACFL04_01035 [Patescibacteria group bacterium]
MYDAVVLVIIVLVLYCYGLYGLSHWYRRRYFQVLVIGLALDWLASIKMGLLAAGPTSFHGFVGWLGLLAMTTVGLAAGHNLIFASHIGSWRIIKCTNYIRQYGYKALIIWLVSLATGIITAIRHGLKQQDKNGKTASRF